MINTATKQAEELLKESLKELELSKGSVQVGVQKLLRAANILGENDIEIWCEIQLGNKKYTSPLALAIKEFAIETVNIDREFKKRAKENPKKETARSKAAKKNVSTKDSSEWEKRLRKDKQYVDALDKLGLRENIHYTMEERRIKGAEASGGYQNIGTVENIYDSLVKSNKGNDFTYYRTNLLENINYVRRVAHKFASSLYNRLAFSHTPQTSLDILKDEVDSKLLDLNPALAEKLMIAFKSVTSDNPEEWSQALTTCRRFLKGLADTLFPTKTEEIDGRKLGEEQYINRLRAFMDRSVESGSNKELAKSHIDYLGNYLEKINKLSSKGVHAGLNKIEAIKAVFHTYLVAADILDYLVIDNSLKKQKLNIHTATLDELESILGVNRSIAKEIIKLRVAHRIVDSKLLSTIKGVGAKTISSAEEQLSFEPKT